MSMKNIYTTNKNPWWPNQKHKQNHTIHSKYYFKLILSTLNIDKCIRHPHTHTTNTHTTTKKQHCQQKTLTPQQKTKTTNPKHTHNNKKPTPTNKKIRHVNPPQGSVLVVWVWVGFFFVCVFWCVFFGEVFLYWFFFILLFWRCFVFMVVCFGWNSGFAG